MGKYKGKDGNYCQIWKKGMQKLNEHNKKVPYSTRWLYAHLHLLEHLYYNAKIDGFYRSVENLKDDMKMGRRQVIEGVKTLEEVGLIQTWWIHNDKQHPEIHIRAFRILKP